MGQDTETFGRLLKGAISTIATYERKTVPAVEKALGDQIGVSDSTIERYKGGKIPVEPERVKALAEAAVRQGYMNREWLQQFLHAARYPERDTLLDQLAPLGPQRPRLPRVYENLPAPTYSQFVMRQQAFADVLDGLQQRSAVVLVVGLGGNGKTSLAREVAACCLKDDSDGPRFDAVVWVSDKDRPGTTNLSTVLDEVARTLDYPGFTQFEHDEKRREVEQLLRRQRVLLVVDNFETVTDGALLSWLLRLPEPSKAIVTTREYRRELRSSWPLELRGMSDAEAQTLVVQRLRVLKIEQLVSDQAQLEPLVAVTGGNPKAIEIALGLVKYERRPLQQVVDDLHGARGELFDDLFARAWSLLDESARRVVMVATFFPTSASSDALAATADVQGYSFERAVERLTDLALLDVQQVDLAKEARYALHPLVRVFAGARLEGEVGFEEGARERWIGWYKQLAENVGYCWGNLDKLKSLDHEQSAIYKTIEWLFQRDRYSETINVIKGIGYYYYVRGDWDKSLQLNYIRIEAAQQENNVTEEIISMSYIVQFLSRQDRMKEATYYIGKLLSVLVEEQLSYQDKFEVYYSLILYYTKISDKKSLIFLIKSAIDLSDMTSYDDNNNYYYRLAAYFYQQQDIDQASTLFQKGFTLLKERGYERVFMFQQLSLATLQLHQGNFDGMQTCLVQAYTIATKNQERTIIARIQQLYARLHTLRNDLPAARASLAEAIDLFERLGMRRELAEARAALADLDAREASAD